MKRKAFTLIEVLVVIVIIGIIIGIAIPVIQVVRNGGKNKATLTQEQKDQKEKAFQFKIEGIEQRRLAAEKEGQKGEIEKKKSNPYGPLVPEGAKVDELGNGWIVFEVEMDRLRKFICNPKQKLITELRE